MCSRSVGFLLAASFLQSGSLAVAAKKKKPEKEITQVLELPKDPPSAIVADSTRLVFHVSPLSAKGLLSQQLRDGLKALFGAAHGAGIVKIRAFVAGSGDLRRVPQVISDEFADRKQPLPVVSVVQVGGLPLEGAQVVLESTAVDKRPSAPNGIAFLSGQPGTAKDAPAPLLKVLEGAGLGGADVRRVTCFVHALEHVSGLRGQIAAAFPKAAANFVQLQRDSAGDFVECEATAVLPKATGETLGFAGSRRKQHSDVAFAGPGKLAITGTQLAFNQQESDVRLALGRLQKSIESVGGSLKKAAFVGVYPLTRSVAEKVNAARFDYFSAERPPASTALLFEGLPSLDASFALDAVSVVSP